MDSAKFDKVVEMLESLGGATGDAVNVMAAEYAVGSWFAAACLLAMAVGMAVTSVLVFRRARTLKGVKPSLDTDFHNLFGCVCAMVTFALTVSAVIAAEGALTPHFSILKQLLR